jgi:hypothetical protein
MYPMSSVTDQCVTDVRRVPLVEQVEQRTAQSVDQFVGTSGFEPKRARKRRSVGGIAINSGRSLRRALNQFAVKEKVL